MEFMSLLRTSSDYTFQNEPSTMEPLFLLTEGFLPKREIRIRTFEPIVLNERDAFSVQGSSQHAAIPKDAVAPTLYSAMEIAFMHDYMITDASKVLKDKELLHELRQYQRQNVYNYVPVELIERIYQSLKKDSPFL